MRKILLTILCVFCSGAAMAAESPCKKRLRVGTISVCLTQNKETVPSLGAKFADGSIYYASTVPGMHGGITFKTEDNFYTLDNQYELIHWLSGEDELVDGVWRDRLADTTSDSGGAMNFTNNGCTWNEEHTGYYSADGLVQFFKTPAAATQNFGTDWYMEVVAKAYEPLGTDCYIVDLASLTNSIVSASISISNRSDGERVPGRIYSNTKVKNNQSKQTSVDMGVSYNWGDKALFTTGVTAYNENESRAFVTWDGNRYYSPTFDTQLWNKWATFFFLFRGFQPQWTDSRGFESIYQCGPTTIYDIKVWRKK